MFIYSAFATSAFLAGGVVMKTRAEEEHVVSARENGTNTHLLFRRDVGESGPGALPYINLLSSYEFFLCFLGRAHVKPEWMSSICG